MIKSKRMYTIQSITITTFLFNLLPIEYKRRKGVTRTNGPNTKIIIAKITSITYIFYFLITIEYS